MKKISLDTTRQYLAREAISEEGGPIYGIARLTAVIPALRCCTVLDPSPSGNGLFESVLHYTSDLLASNVIGEEVVETIGTTSLVCTFQIIRENNCPLPPNAERLLESVRRVLSQLQETNGHLPDDALPVARSLQIPHRASPITEETPFDIITRSPQELVPFCERLVHYGLSSSIPSGIRQGIDAIFPTLALHYLREPNEGPIIAATLLRTLLAVDPQRAGDVGPESTDSKSAWAIARETIQSQQWRSGRWGYLTNGPARIADLPFLSSKLPYEMLPLFTTLHYLWLMAETYELEFRLLEQRKSGIH